jgi:hypothetical protein
MRTRFIAKLPKDDPDSQEIRNHIAALHRRLSDDPLKDKKDNPITFERVCVGKNPKTKEELEFYGWTYTVERQKAPAKQVYCQVIDKSKAVFKAIVQPGQWDEEAFQLLADYLALDVKKRSPLLTCYQGANPYLFKSLLASATEKNPMEMDGYKFVADAPAIFAGLIDVLYAMRNLLFHGELVPDAQANRTYEPAYHLLRHLTATIV